MGAFLDKPNTEKHTVAGGSDESVRYGVTAMQGWRVEMEDAHTAVDKIEDHDKWSFFAVFDGHAGPKCAKYASENLLKHILTKIGEKESNTNVDLLKEAIAEGFLELDDEIRTANSEDTSGTTAVGVLVTETHILFANCGDSRGLFCNGGQLSVVTEDHKPYVPTEKERIEKAGGNVVLQRVNGSLAVSRALGDMAYKRMSNLGPTEQLVSPLPDVKIAERREGDEFVVLACDGVWDVMNNEEVAAFVRRRLALTDDLCKIGCDLIDTCLHRGSRDNMSVIIVTFKDAPHISEKAIEEDKKRSEETRMLLEKKIKEMVDNNEVESLDDMFVMQQLCKDLPDEHEVPLHKEFVSDTLEKMKNHKYEVRIHEKLGLNSSSSTSSSSPSSSS